VTQQDFLSYGQFIASDPQRCFHRYAKLVDRLYKAERR